MFTRQTDNLANAVRLLVAMGGLAAAPSPRTGLAVYDAIRRLAERPPASLATLATSLTDNARAVLAGYRDAPPDAALLYEQMVAASLLTPEEITAAGMDAAAVTVAMQARLRDPSHRTGPMLDLFGAITAPTLKPLLASKAYAADLTPAFMRQLLMDAAEIKEALSNLTEQTRGTLEAFATAFGEPRPDRMADRELRGFIYQKADDLRALHTEVEALRAAVPQPGDALATVEAAIEAMDFEGAERLLADIREAAAGALRAPLETNARMIEAQARVALLRGNVADAARLYATAADSFAAVDPAEPIRRRVAAAQVLQEHGQRYGGDAFLQAIALVENVLPDAADRLPIGEVVAADHALASIYEDQGRLLSGAGALAWLERAASLFRIIADALDRDAGNKDAFAAARTSLGSVLTEIARRRSGDAALALLTEARGAHEDALAILDETAQPGNWIAAKAGLATTLRHLAQHVPGDEASPMLAAARAALEDTLRHHDRDAEPRDWGMTRYSIGNIAFQQSQIASGPGQLDLLQEALSCYFDAVEALPRERYPLDWASASYALATGYALLGSMAEGETGLDALRKALGTLGDVLEVQREAGSEREVAKTLLAAAGLFEVMAGNEASPDPEGDLHSAISCLDAARDAYGDDATDEETADVAEAQERIRAKVAALH